MSHFISLVNFDLFSMNELNGRRVWLIREDFPEPDTPVIHVNKPTGISAEIFCKLFSEELTILIFSFPRDIRFFGILISLSPDKY